MTTKRRISMTEHDLALFANLSTARYQPSSLLYSWLRRLHEAKLLHHICRPVARAWPFPWSWLGLGLPPPAASATCARGHSPRPSRRSWRPGSTRSGSN